MDDNEKSYKNIQFPEKKNERELKRNAD